MLIVKTTELELMQGWFDSDPEHTRVRVAFPVQAAFGRDPAPGAAPSGAIGEQVADGDGQQDQRGGGHDGDNVHFPPPAALGISWAVRRQ